MEERYKVVHDGSGLNRCFRTRNPHMKRDDPRLTAHLVWESPDGSPGRLHLNRKRVHIFDCFALVNRLLCSAHSEGSRGRPTPTMFGNCDRHFAATLRILQPTLVIVQGKGVWERTRLTLPVRRKLSPTLLERDLNETPTTVCAFTHPSARHPYRWDSPSSPYFREVVRPTLRRALRRI